MRTPIVLACLALAACVSDPVERAAVAQDKTRILITVNLERMADIRGTPSRFFGYGSSYAHFPRAQRLLRELSKDYDLAPMDAWPIKSLGVLCQVFSVQTQNAAAIIYRLQHDSRVESAQVMNEFHTSSGNDPYRKLQNNLEQMGVIQAHQFATGRNIKVAIIDTHVDSAHPELRHSVPFQRVLLPDIEVRADRHGTAIAGIIAAHRYNDEGILGVAPDARIMALTACWAVPNARGRCNSFTLARALDLAITHKANVINLSLSGPPDPLLVRLVNQALKNNTIVVGAIDPQHKNTFPGEIPGVLGVTMTTTGANILEAPGDEVLTTIPGGGYDFVSGNSIATAHVTGIAALALEARPSLSSQDLRQALLDTRQDNGQVNACRTLRALNKACQCAEQLAITSPLSH